MTKELYEEKEEAFHYGINGCSCRECCLDRFHATWRRIENLQLGKEDDFSGFIKNFKESSNIITLAKTRYNIDVKQKKMLCIFHQEETPSFVLYEKTNTYHCFGCGETGDIVDFISQMEKRKKKISSQQRAIISPSQRYRLLKLNKWICSKCGTKLKYNKHSKWEGEVGHIDHIHPFSKRMSYPGGVEKINEDANMRALCAKCNLKKYNGID